MDAHYMVVLISLFAFTGVQTYTDSKIFSPEGHLRNPRSTNDREAEEHHHHRHHYPMVCCDSKTEISQEEAESNRKAITKCRKFESAGLEDRNKSVCLMNCVMEALNLKEENGRIKKRALDIIMEHHNDVMDDDLRKKIKKICYDEGAGPLDATFHTECNKESYNLIACAHHVKEMLCPNDKRIEGRRCDEYREEMKKIYSI